MGAWPLSAERKIEVSAEQRLQMYVVNGSDGRCLVAVRLIVGVRYLERPLREVLLYIHYRLCDLPRNPELFSMEYSIVIVEPDIKATTATP